MATTNSAIDAKRLENTLRSETSSDNAKATAAKKVENVAMTNQGVTTGANGSTSTSGSAKDTANEQKQVANNALSQATAQLATASSSGDLNLSQYLPEMASKPEALSEIELDTSDLDKWLASATEQSNNKIDYAVEQGVNEYNRAYEDALPQYQTQRNQVDINEAKAKDNQALYAEARGDKGGIGAAQYDTIMNTAMVQRREISTAQTKLATDTARSIADLRAQGEFEKEDALLQLTQTYLSKLQDLKQFTLEYNMNIQQFNAEMEKWWENYKMEYAQLQMQVEETEYNARQASIARAAASSSSSDTNYTSYDIYKEINSLIGNNASSSYVSSAISSAEKAGAINKTQSGKLSYNLENRDTKYETGTVNGQTGYTSMTSGDSYKVSNGDGTYHWEHY